MLIHPNVYEHENNVYEHDNNVNAHDITVRHERLVVRDVGERLQADGLLREDRHQLILDRLSDSESLRVSTLSDDLGVSEMTIRRDLSYLEDLGVLQRVHGGAVHRLPRPSFPERSASLPDEKWRIAKAVAGRVDDGETIALDIGTTTSMVARALRDHQNLFVATNSINAASELASGASVARHPATRNQILLIGGLLHGDSGDLTLVGPWALDIISQLRFDKLILGCGGIRIDRGFVYYDVEEVRIRQVMLESAASVIVVADHSKFGKECLASMAPIERADVIVTDALPDPEIALEIERRGVELHVARG